MWELDHKESWVLKNWCLQIVMLEKTLESPLDSKEIKPVNPKGIQSWIFIGKIDVEAEAPILWCNTLHGQYNTGCEELTRWKRPWCWERLKAGGEGDDRGRDGWMASPTWWTWVWASSQKLVIDREAWRAAVHGVAKNWIWLSNWTELAFKSPAGLEITPAFKKCPREGQKKKFK